MGTLSKVSALAGILLVTLTSYSIWNTHNEIEKNEVELKEASYNMALACIQYDDPACRQPMRDLLLKCNDSLFDFETCKLALEYSKRH